LLVATVWHPATNANMAMALTMLVSVNSFFILFCVECVVWVLSSIENLEVSFKH
jgi:hypothetical protein